MRARDEALLVRLDGEANDFRRDFQIIFLERAHQHMRPLDKTGDLFQQAFVFDQVKAIGKGQIARIMQDHVLAALGIQHDLGLFQARHIIIKAAYGDGIRRMEAMTIGDVGGGDAVDIEGDHLGFIMLRPEDADDGLQRAHPAQAFRSLALDAGIA